MLRRHLRQDTREGTRPLWPRTMDHRSDSYREEKITETRFDST